MFSRQKLFFWVGAYWLVYMVVIRLVFLLYNYDLAAGLQLSEIGLALWKGLRMDLSITGYFMLLYGLILTFSTWFPGKWWKTAVNSSTFVLLGLSGALVAVDNELYRHWGFRTNNTPLLYIGPEAFGSISLWIAVKGLFIFFLLWAAFWVLYRKTIARRLKGYFPRVSKWGFAGMLLLTAAMILPIRGSLTVAPMNTGFVYFHNSKPFANHAAINVVWNFLASLSTSSSVRYPEDFFDKNRTAELMEELYADTTAPVRLLKIPKPNILVIILEGFTADIVGTLGGLPDITPNLNGISGKGVLFSHFYASGDRTDKGLVSILSGYPAQTRTSIVKFPDKTQHLPSLTRELGNAGYHTSFLYGGDADFANFRSYLANTGFETITDLDDFPARLNTSKWGVHDQYMFERLIDEIDTTTTPFFKTVLTLSSHEPFDVPVKPYIRGNDEESLYLNSCRYTDECLGKFIKEARQQPWWDSTLVVITADHGNRHPGNKRLEDERRFRIPLIFSGGALAVDSLRVDKMGGQTDIANTVLGQMGEKKRIFGFSKDLLSPGTVPFAAFFFQNGYGFVLPGKQLIYDHAGRNFVVNPGGDSRAEDLSKAYQQALFSDYNSR